MGLWSWVKKAVFSGTIRKEVDSKERAYYWVSEGRRKLCRKIITKAQRNMNVLVLPWDEWHACMRVERKPWREFKFVKDFRFIVNFIKELVGIKEEKIEVIEIPPVRIIRKPGKPEPKPRPPKKKPEKIPKRKKPKEKIRPRRPKFGQRFVRKKPKPPKEPKKKRDPVGRSNLNINLFSRGLRWRNLIRPEFLLKFENINEKLLDEIGEINK